MDILVKTLLGSVLLSISSALVYGQCLITTELQTKTGVGTDQKVGFTPASCSGCETKYYRGYNASTASTSLYEETSAEWVDLHWVVKSVSAEGVNMQFYKKDDSGSCSSSSYTLLTGLKSFASMNERFTQAGTVCVHTGSSYSTDGVNFTTEGTLTPDCMVFAQTGWECTSSTTADACSIVRSIQDCWTGLPDVVKCHSYSEINNSGGYVDEYTTTELLGNAESCAASGMTASSFIPGTPYSACILENDNSAASVVESTWRIKVTGAERGAEYIVKLMWSVESNGEVTTHTLTESWTAGADLVQYYPSEDGRGIPVQMGTECGYRWIKWLSASIEPKDGSGCGGGGCPIVQKAASFDNSTIVSVDLGPGSYTKSLGTLAVLAGHGTAKLASRESVRYYGDPDLPETTILTARDGISQVLTPRLLVNVASNSASSTTIRVMNIAAQGSWNGSTYNFDTSESFLLLQYAIENPDAGSATNRVRVREFSSSHTNEWMYNYTATNSGWNVTLPDGSGSMDLVSTNHASGAYTLIRRYRNPSGGIIAQQSQVYTNLAWGYSLVQESSGVGSEARIRNIEYYTGTTTNAPYTPTTSRLPIKKIEEPDGSWRYVVLYTSAGLVKTELHGIDSGVTTDTNLCLRTEYTYTSQDGSDTLSREPEKPRKIEEWWKGTLIRRTYHIYTATSHKVIECPNPSNAINDSNNLVTETVYISGTMVVDQRHYPDQTFTKYWVTGGTEDAYTGEDDGGGSVRNGVHVQTVRSAIGTVLSIKEWNITEWSENVQTRDSVWSDFDFLNRPQSLEELGSLTTTMSYDCCGIDSKTDPDGLVTSFGHDALKRQDLISRWGVTDQKVFDSANRVIEERRIGTDSTNIRLQSQGYDTSGFVVSLTNALNGIKTIARSKMMNGFDQILTTNPDGGTNLQLFWANGRLERSTGNASAPNRFIYGVTNTTYLGVGRTLQYQMEIKLDASGADTSEWVVSCFDGLSRLVKRILPGSATYETEYNNKGQKIREIDPDGVWTLYRYDSKGKMIVTAVDVDHDQYVDNFDAGQSGSDRITQGTTSYLAYDDASNSRGVDIRVDEQRVWTTASSSATALVRKTETSTDGLNSWTSLYKDQSTPVTSARGTTYGGGGSRTVTDTAADGSKVVTSYSYGRPITITAKNSSNGQVTKTDISYDAHGRRYQSIDARNGTTTFTYNNCDQVATVTTPIPGTGQPAQTTSTSYDSSMRAQYVTQPDGGVTINEYTTMGLLKKTSGRRTYPVEYTYDAQGRVKTMKTWQDFAGNSGTATTTWNYDSGRGWLANKRYNDNTGPDYTYTAGGRLQTRSWARTGTGGNRILTTYSYGLSSGSWHGDITGIAYSYSPQSTPNVTYTYDRRGRKTGISSSNAAFSYTYFDNDVEGTLTHGSGPLIGVVLTHGYNSAMQLTSISANTPTSVSQSFTYDNAGRLSTATDGAYNATYSYATDSKLVSQILYKNNSTTRLTTTKTWDYLNRLLETTATPSGSGELPVKFNYAYNNANQRIACTMSDGSYWEYQYDALGQVVSGKRFWADGTPVAGQQCEYRFDDIGNRASAKFGGDSDGQNLQTSSYTKNLLNQYSQRTVPAVASVLGLATAAATVTVNDQSTYRKGEYFWKELNVTNSSASVWLAITNKAVNGASSTTVTGNQYIPKTAEMYTYDTEGNLTADGRWNYYWDAENRLVQMISVTANGPQQKIVFYYDALGRRLRKVVWNNTAGTGSPVKDIKFLYEGWNLIAELDTLNSNVNIRSYLWGNDLSGSRQGAGGVGGLLAVKNSSGVAQFPVFDGNGNITRLVAGDAGTYSANYEYGPFGETVRASGSYAATNPVRFSTKYEDSESQMLYYGHRYYTPSTGRWLSRDPIEEEGGENLYGFVSNDSIRIHDAFGLRMTLRVQEMTLQAPPTQGPLKGAFGATMWNPFQPTANVWRSISEPCCWKINFSGYATILFWYIPGTQTYTPGVTVRDHEVQHVAYFQSTFNDYNDHAEGLATGCYSKEKAECLSSAITGILKKAYLTRNNYVNGEFDCSVYGAYDPRGCQMRDKAANFPELLLEAEEAIQKCNQMP